MRTYIDIANKLFETIVYRDRGPDPTVIAINPTKLEWKTNFPKGAAGVYCTNGDLVVGEGPVLAHDVLLDRASVDQHLEKYRLQLGPVRGYAELWMTDEAGEHLDTLTNPDERARFVNEQTSERYGADLDSISHVLTQVCQRMHPGYECRAIAMNFDQEGVLPGDEEWRASCW